MIPTIEVQASMRGEPVPTGRKVADLRVEGWLISYETSDEGVVVRSTGEQFPSLEVEGPTNYTVMCTLTGMIERLFLIWDKLMESLDEFDARALLVHVDFLLKENDAHKVKYRERGDNTLAAHLQDRSRLLLLCRADLINKGLGE